MENTANHITLTGTVAEAPALSHRSHARSFFRFLLQVPRLSGTVDVLPVIVPQELLEDCAPAAGDCVRVTGQIRSFNCREENRRRLILCVYASTLALSRLNAENDALLTGAVCREPVFRRTPLGREICDVMLAVNRLYRRADYIPCILWGRCAQMASRLNVGAELRITGRLQSREYTKVLPEGAQVRTAYELSAADASEISEEFSE